jgi:hypothetical protein
VVVRLVVAAEQADHDAEIRPRVEGVRVVGAERSLVLRRRLRRQHLRAGQVVGFADVDREVQGRGDRVGVGRSE